MDVRAVVTFVVTTFLGLKPNADITLERKINTYKKQPKISSCLTEGENLTTRYIPNELHVKKHLTTKLTTQVEPG
jgi:hypothetical protein